MLRRILLASAGAIAFSGAAFAAEPAPPPPPPPPPVWTDFYIGLNAGGTWTSSNTIDVVTVPIAAVPPAINVFPVPTSRAAALAATGTLAVSNSGFIGGGQLGYNYQFGPSFVAGIEADIQGIAGSRESSSLFRAVDALSALGFPGNFATALTTVNRRVDYLGTVRGRLGWLITPTLLIYGDGGLAYGGISSTASIIGQNVGVNLGLCCGNPPFASFGSLSETRVGWTAGGGAEWMFLPNWSAKVEYLYYDLGRVIYSAGFPTATARAPGAVPAGTPIFTLASQASARFNGNIVRAGINYHF
jgi:outer membrane immunogenic protein